MSWFEPRVSLDPWGSLISDGNSVLISSLWSHPGSVSLPIKCRQEAVTGYRFRRPRLLLILPSAVAGVCGIVTAVGGPPWVGALSAVCGFLTAVASGLGVDKSRDCSPNSGKPMDGT
jgi:hypothetical protein